MAADDGINIFFFIFSISYITKKMYTGYFIRFINECISKWYSKFSRRLLPKTPLPALGMQITNLWVTECLRVGHLYFYKIIWAVHCIWKGQYTEQVIITNTSHGRRGGATIPQKSTSTLTTTLTTTLTKTLTKTPVHVTQG